MITPADASTGRRRDHPLKTRRRIFRKSFPGSGRKRRIGLQFHPAGALTNLASQPYIWPLTEQICSMMISKRRSLVRIRYIIGFLL